MNLVDNETRRHALMRRLMGAASKEALAALLAEWALRPSLAGGENTALMERRGAAVVDQVLRIEETVAIRHAKHPPPRRRSRAWRAADAVFDTSGEDGGRGVGAPRTAGR